VRVSIEISLALRERAEVSVKVAPRVLLISLSLWERAGVRETIMVPTTYTFRGGVGAMIVSPLLRKSWPNCRRNFNIVVVVVVVVEYPCDYDYDNDNDQSLRPLFLVPALPG